MTNLFLKGLVVIPVVLLAGCAQIPHIEESISDSEVEVLGQKLDVGWGLWRKAKNIHGANYQYITEFHSWVGFGNRTTLVVTKDQVSERHYESWGREPGSMRQWSETVPNELGSHKAGASLKTMDELYVECRDEVLIKNSSKFDVKLILGRQGEIKTCTYQHTFCADDCTRGIRVSNFSFTKPF